MLIFAEDTSVQYEFQFFMYMIPERSAGKTKEEKYLPQNLDAMEVFCQCLLSCFVKVRFVVSSLLFG